MVKAKKLYTLRLEEEMLAKIENSSRKSGTTISDFIRNAVSKELGKQDLLTELRDLMREEREDHKRITEGISTIAKIAKRVHPNALGEEDQ